VYQPRTYRHWIKSQDLVPFTVVVRETDLYIRATSNLKRKALKLVLKYRDMLERYIEQNPLFLTTLKPIPIADDAPRIVRLMAESTAPVGVGPMASVAGAISELVGYELLDFTPEVIIENGGDIFIKSLRKRLVGIYAGDSPLTGKIGFEIDAEDTPIGISTSSGTVGHSLSFGKADAVVTVCRSSALADAAATAIGNVVMSADTIADGIELAKGIPNLRGVIIIKDDQMGAWGNIKLCQTEI
jgi:hypothetical protein